MAKKRHNPPITEEDKKNWKEARNTERDKVIGSKRRLAEKYSSEIEKLGYSMGHGVSLVGICDENAPESEKDKFCISTLLQPLPGKEDNMPDDLLARIRDQVLPKEWEGYKVFVKYVGRIIAA